MKLCDFGCAVQMSPEEKQTEIFGTPFYLSPEMIISQGYDQRVDIWSLGILCFELLTGSTPFQDVEEAMIYIKIMQVNT